MKVLLLTPAPHALHLGGRATVERYRDGLQRRGHLCEVLGGVGEGGLKQSLEGTIARFRPDLVHAHDAARCGVHLLGSRTPWVVSLSGEDLHVDAVDDAPTRELVARLRGRTDTPIAVGIGVRDRATAQEVATFADGVIVGSALLRAVADGEPAGAPERVRALVSDLRAGMSRA